MSLAAARNLNRVFDLIFGPVDPSAPSGNDSPFPAGSPAPGADLAATGPNVFPLDPWSRKASEDAA